VSFAEANLSPATLRYSGGSAFLTVRHRVSWSANSDKNRQSRETQWHERPEPISLGYGSISTPGLSKACGSIVALAALRAAANKGGRCRSYQRRWSRPTA
jgi:hypothetical protein